MNNSQLIIYTYKEPLYCCCFIRDSLMACCSKKAIIIWDFAQGILISNYLFEEESSPIAISVINEEEYSLSLLLQLKSTKVIILIFDKESKTLVNKYNYQLQMIGFTKLSIATYVYNENNEVRRQINKQFLTISYKNRIEKRSLLQGSIKEQYQIDQTAFEDVCYLISYQIQDKTYFLVVQQGAIFKLFHIPQESSILQVSKTMQLESKEQIKIVLSIQPANNCKGFVCLRNSNIYIINLQQLVVIETLNIKELRMIKTIPSQQQIYAISSKNGIGLLKQDKVILLQKIGKCFIIEIDTFDLGIIGVTQQGKIILLPLL